MTENITVQVDDEHVAHLDGVAEQLKAAGMHVDQVLEAIGIITGTANTQVLAALEQVPGVTIETQHDFTIAPPNSDVQ